MRKMMQKFEAEKDAKRIDAEIMMQKN